MIYKRRAPFLSSGKPGHLIAVKFLMVAHSMLFGFQILFAKEADILQQCGALAPQVLEQGEVWRLWTALLFQPSIVSWGMTMVGLVVFGRTVEHIWGTRRLFTLYLGSAALVFLPTLLLGDSGTLWYGSLGPVVAVAAVYWLLYPDKWVLSLIPAWAGFVSFGMLASLVLYLLAAEGTGNFVSTQIPVFGALAGILIFYLEYFGHKAWVRLQARREISAFQGELEMRDRVDRLLEKISIGGIDSLSRAERKFLLQASKKFRQKLASHQVSPF